MIRSPTRARRREATVVVSCPPDLLYYWWRGRLIAHRVMAGTEAVLSPTAAILVQCFQRKRSLHRWLATVAHEERGRLTAVIRELVKAGILCLSSNRGATGVAQGCARRDAGWDEWNPAAGLLHFSAKHACMHAQDAEQTMGAAGRRMARRPRPAQTKHMTGERLVLPPPNTEGVFASVLLARRTWQRFGTAPLTAAELSHLLWLTWGVHGRVIGEGRFSYVLKTSPSGGGLHPLEAYVAVAKVRGLSQGLYHYDSVGHALTRVPGSRSRIDLTRYIPGQWWYRDAAALVFMTAVFERVQWKYASPRAYRSILLEAGHFAQTFCLTATSAGLAPFCTAALADPLIERELSLDGVTESVIYAVGVGTRAKGATPLDWPPHVDGRPYRDPRRAPPRRR